MMKKIFFSKFYSKVKISLLVVFLSILAGCVTATPTQNISEPTELDDEGILITKIRTNIKNSSITIHGKGEKWSRAYFSPIEAPEDLRVIKIKSGPIYFSKFFESDNGFVSGPRNYIMIEPDTITYIGDIVVEWVVKDGGIGANILLIDREDETVTEAKEQYPWIFEKYPYRKGISCAETFLVKNM